MASDQFQPLQGMSDIAVPDVSLWQGIESHARTILDTYGYTEIRTPVLEKTDVFTRSVGETTDIVQKEMYSFTDRGRRNISLRPEGTASVIRYVASAGQALQDARLFYIGPMFRAERPQAGRKRQFHQLGVEAIGEPCPAIDAETIAMELHLLKAWGLKGGSLEINTRGTGADHIAVVEGLKSELSSNRGDLSKDSQRRFDENVLRILDSKDAGDREIVNRLPSVTEFMSEDSRKYLEEVLSYLDLLEIPYVVNPKLVRGLDYYEHTVWEITHPALGAQDALSGGGRYNMKMGSKNIRGVGFGIGLERVISALQETNETGISFERALDIWAISLGDAALKENIMLIQSLRHRGLKCGMDMGARSMKAQMRAANRGNARFVVIRGEDEIEKGVFLLKDMEESTQDEVDMPQLMNRVLSLHAVK